MLLPMFMLGLIYNTVQNALPKLFEERMVDVLGGQIGFVGSAVGLVYGIATIMQLVGGYLADRYSLKHVYLYLWILQAPLLYILARYGGLPLGLAAVGLTMAGMAILPAENLMLSRFAPKAHQGLVFGIKFVVSFGAAPLGLFLLTRTRESTGDFTGLLTAYAIATAFIVLVVLTLPDQRKERLSEQT
jgi:MFS family permease